MAEAELIVDPARAEAVAGEWDALAVARGRPLSAPAWMLGWWRHVAPRPAELRIVAVHDRGSVVGIVPLYLENGRAVRRYRMLAHDFGAVMCPLAWPDREWEVAQATAELLSAPHLRPDLLDLGPLPVSSPWSLALRERWPGRVRPLSFRLKLLAEPTVMIEGRSYADWLAGLSGRARADMRRRRRLFEQGGGVYRFADARSMSADLRVFADLHARRWEGRGTSRLVALGERLPAVLGDIAETLAPDGRFRLLMLELDGRPICAHLCIAAGGEVVTFNFGWDEQHRRLSPPLLAAQRTIEDSCARGERRLDLGWGDNPYKERMANGRDAVTWEALLPPGARLSRALPGVLLGVAESRARATVKRTLSEAQVARLRELRAAAARYRV